LAESADPQSPQNRLSPGLSAPHFGQRFASAVPQSPQNFLLGGFSVLQFEQRIGLLDDTLAEAHTSLAMVMYEYEFDWAGSEREFRRAIELNPNYAFTHDQYGYVLMFTGRFDESVAEMKRASELDPLSAGITMDLGFALLYQGKYAAANEQFCKALELDPCDRRARPDRARS
jgi:tetratricopeptide (TPR) repeat protein